MSFDNPGMWYALAAGALASASGYVIWYMVVVRFTVTVAAVVQLSVPVITAIGGVLFVNEPITLRVASVQRPSLAAFSLRRHFEEDRAEVKKTGGVFYKKLLRPPSSKRSTGGRPRGGSSVGSLLERAFPIWGCLFL